MNPHHVVVVGGGIAGLEIANQLPQAGRRSRGNLLWLADTINAYVRPRLRLNDLGVNSSRRGLLESGAARRPQLDERR